MAREKNFLLGNGELLTGPVDVASGGGQKKPPYTFEQAQKRFGAMLHEVNSQVNSLPRDACPHGEAVAAIAMHPRYISKSSYPSDFLKTFGLRSIGSKSRLITPDSWGIDKHPSSAVTEEIFVAGPKTAFSKLEEEIKKWTAETQFADQLSHFEQIKFPEATSKLKTIPENQITVTLEVVLHTDGNFPIVDSFITYAKKLGADPLTKSRRDVRGLTFLPVIAVPAILKDLAEFTFVRIARGMPSLRPFRPGILRSSSGFPFKLPTEVPLTPIRAVIFDGGLSAEAVNSLSPWVTYHEPTGISLAVPEYQSHGLAVTGAVLFGTLERNKTLPIPFCHIDHVRVLDDQTGTDLAYVDVLDRIVKYLDQNKGNYDFVNISLGPSLPVSDDEITAWTALLDERFAGGHCLVTVAAGNDGDLDSESGLNRVQPPSDGVNLLAVGASNIRGSTWQRADYSCIGPGRSPGLVKPDGLAFGGSEDEPFMVAGLTGTNFKAVGDRGTSFASPLLLRSGISVKAQLGNGINQLLVKALLLHRADGAEFARTDVGWGRFEEDLEKQITCEDDEALVLYKGMLPVGQHLRAPIPLPPEQLKGMVTITATLTIAPEIDPGHPGSYTRSGVEIAFRPHSGKFVKRSDGSLSRHPKTVAFFSSANMYGASEVEFRDDGSKWEPVLRSERQFRAASLQAPCFDIYYHHRAAGQKVAEPESIPYALVISVRAPKITDLYNKVVRSYSNILVPIRPQLVIPVTTKL